MLPNVNLPSFTQRVRPMSQLAKYVGAKLGGWPHCGLWLALLCAICGPIIPGWAVAASQAPGKSVDRRAVSPLATPTLSATAPATMRAAQPVPTIPPPAVYDSALIHFSQIYLPDALLGVTYKKGAAKPFDASALLLRQTQMPENLCQNVMNRLACGQKREQYLLMAGDTGLVRQHDELRIPLSNQATIVLTDTQGTGGGWASYAYVGYLPSLRQHHVTVVYDEGANELLINADTGETTVLPYSSPVVSPDHKRLAVVTTSSAASVLNVQIWNAQRPHLNVEADLAIENLGPQQITKTTWLDATQVQIAMINQATASTGAMTVTLTTQGWQAYVNGQKIAAPALHPGSLGNPYTIWGVDTVAVGKPIYADRAYKFKRLPAVVQGQQYLLFANNNMRNTDKDYVHFTLAQPATVYIAFDMEASELPNWLAASWQPTPDIITTEDVVKLRLYQKRFAAGDEVTLGGNWAPPASGVRSHYLVLVVPLQNE